MIYVKLGQFLPDPNGRPIFDDYDFDYVPHRTVLEYIELSADQIDFAVHEGRIYRGQDLWFIPLNDGDTVHLLPSLEGKNAALILGVVGAVIGYYFGGPAGSAAAFQWAMAGWAIGSTVGALITPHPKITKSGDGALTSHQWQGISNEDQPGVPVPIPFGWMKTGGVRIGAFTRRNGTLDEELHLLVLVGRGQIEAIEDIRLNDQPYTNYPNVTVDVRLGTTAQSVIPGFNAIVNTYAQNVDLTNLGAGISYTYTSFRGDMDAFEVLLTMPGLSHTKSNGDLRQNTTTYRLEYQRVGDSTWTNADAAHGNQKDVTGSTRSTMFETRRVEGLTPGQYNIRVTWLSAANTDASVDLWHLFLTGVTEEKQDARTYDGYALVAVRAVAMEQLQGAIPTVSCMVKGLKVPTWNGVSFDVPTWSGSNPNAPPGRNPAWLVLELLRNPTWGLGNILSDANIDLPSFKAWADYCNEMVTVTLAGGGTFQEARHQLDIVLNQQSKALDVLQQLCAVSRASLVLSGNKFKIVLDKPGVPVQLFSMGNIRRGSFAYQTRREANRTNAYDVVINDRAREFDTSPFRVVSRQKVTIEGESVRPQTLNLPGITRKSHAVRETTFRLNALLYLGRQIAFEAATDAILCEAGDIISFSHDVPQWGYSGRTMPVSESEDQHIVYVDQYLTIDATQNYEITIRPDSGTHEPGYVARVYGADQPYGSGQYNFVKLRDPLPFPITDGMLYAFGPYQISTKPFRIIAITRSDEGFRKIEAIEYNDSVSNDADEIVVTTYTDLPNWGGPPAPITDGKAYEEISQRKDDRWVSTIIVQWTKPLPNRAYGAYRGAKVQRSWNYIPSNPAAATWEDWAYTDGTEQRWYDAPHGVLIAFKIIPKAANGKYNTAGAFICYLTTQGYSVAPPAVSSFFAEVLDNAFVWTWAEQAKSVQYELRNANSGWGDNDATKLVWRGRAQRFVLDTPSQRSITLYIKAIDDSGNVSVGAVSATCNDTAPPAPAIGPVERYKNSLKVKVTPPSPTADYVAIHLHASKQPGFTPTVNAGPVRNVATMTRSGQTVTVTTTAAHGIANGDPAKITGATQPEYNGTFRATVTGSTTFTFTLDVSATPATPATGTITAQAQPNRVAGVVGPQGGEFIFQINESGNWYFRAAIEDWMTEKLQDWVYSGELASTLALIIPAAPFGVAINEDTTDVGDPGRGIKTPDGGGTYIPIKMQRNVVSWGFTENPANPAGSLLGFQVILYSTDPNAPLYDAGIIANPAARSTRFTDYQVKNATTVIAAVKSIYSDSITSPYVTSTGLTLDPGSDPPLATSAYVDQRMGDVDLPMNCVDYFAFDRTARGIRGTDPLTTVNSIYDLDGYGVVVEQFTFGFLTTHDMTQWTTHSCSVTKVTDGSVKPPVRGTWDVFKVTVGGSTGAHDISRSEAVGNRIGTAWNSSFWVMNNRAPSAVVNASVTDGVSGFASPSQNVTCYPGIWTRVQSGAVSSWPNGNTNRIAWLIVQAGQMSPGDVYYVAVPQMTQSYYAHQPVPVSGFRNTGGIKYPGALMSSDNWTIMVRFHRQPQSIPRFPNTNAGYIWEMKGAAGNTILVTQTFNDNRLYVTIVDGLGNILGTASALLPVSALEENALALVRAGNTYKVFLNNGLLIPPFNTSASATQRGAFATLTLGAESTGTDNYAFNGAFRNMAIFNSALSDSLVLGYLAQGIRFATSDPKIVVPKPVSVTLTEV